ncbi:hypothetical protein IW261DRAFT_1461814 [Armillaria novae-zelandiae]|uniref:Uncharacterized protein n=1 Tax=Armillaria novae-zelandiae TaxID=153914 RepID=A0AA39TE63_9AGAR|nr:hypothetical protein IW261DRAFT_1461814 [Armillaria novae-zelandiae]
MFVYHCPMMNCTAYFPKVDALWSRLSLAASALWGGYSSIPSTGSTINAPFTPVPVLAPFTNDNPSQSYGDGRVITPTVVTVTTRIDAHSQLEVENSYIAQYQNDNFGIMHNIRDLNVRFHEDHSATYPVLGPEAWADHHPSPVPSSLGVSSSAS